jgi:uracil-DNA glycosylase
MTSLEIPGLIDCTRCARLVACREAVARKPAKGYSPQDYWSRPVPGFGDVKARLLVVGLAPGAHGANRSGRPFTGDAAGEWLYPTLYKYGFSNAPISKSRDDELRLQDAYISNAVKCVPPGNRPTIEEAANCFSYFEEEFRRLSRLRVVVILGTFALRSYLQWAKEQGLVRTLSAVRFDHGAETVLPNGHHVLTSYHCSRLNTNTGRLTLPMFESVFARAREIIG